MILSPNKACIGAALMDRPAPLRRAKGSLATIKTIARGGRTTTG
jgi:hypothetical protein